MKYVSKVINSMLMLTVLVSLTACGAKSKKLDDYDMLSDTSGLELDQSQAPTMVFIRPGAPTLSAYDRFIIDTVHVSYSDPTMKELDPEQVGEMQQYFRDAMIKELRDAGYEIGTRSQAKTMRISFTLSGLKAPSAKGNVAAIGAGMIVGLPMLLSVSVGEVTVEAVFREALTNRIDAVAVNRAQGSRLLKKKPWSTWADVEGSFDNWAEGIRESIDKAHGR